MLTQTIPGLSRAPAVAGARPAMKVVVYLDASVHSQAGAEMTRALPLPAGSEVTLLAASASDPRLAALLDSSLDQAAALWARDAVLVTRAKAPAPTAQQVTAYATAIDADLVVVSAQGVSSDVGGLLNGMAYQVAEQARSPVLVALAPFTELRRVLLAYDGSLHSLAAARFLARLPLPPDSDVSVLHVATKRSTVEVVPPRWPVGAQMVRPPRATSDQASLDPTLVQQAQDILAGGLTILSEAGVNAHGRLACGNAAELILHDAMVNRADLVVSGSRGLGVMRGWLLGSVSRRLVQSASRSVLIVRED